METMKIEKHGEKSGRRVEIEHDEDRQDIYITQNGHQWVGMPADDELLLMIRDTINQYFLEKDWDGGA